MICKDFNGKDLKVGDEVIGIKGMCKAIFSKKEKIIQIEDVDGHGYLIFKNNKGLMFVSNEFKLSE